jgi:hypothetical protein
VQEVPAGSWAAGHVVLDPGKLRKLSIFCRENNEKSSPVQEERPHLSYQYRLLIFVKHKATMSCVVQLNNLSILHVLFESLNLFAPVSFPVVVPPGAQLCPRGFVPK